MSSQSNNKISPDKKYLAETNGSLLQVFECATDSFIHSLALNKFELRKPEIFRWSQDSKAIGMFIAKSVPVNDGGLVTYKTKYWIGIWYPFLEEFYAVHFPGRFELELNHEPVDSIEVLSEERTVVCSIKGEEFKRVEMPKEQMLSAWDRERQVLGDVKSKPPDLNKKEWTWNEDQYGYEGVHLYGGEVLWFTHTHNPHHGGAAHSQSFEDFLENGAAGSTPDEYFQELYAAVKKLSEKK